MHLLHCSLSADSEQLCLTLCEHFPEEVRYAILSHRWGRAEDEVSYRDLTHNLYRQKKGFQKVESCCKQALRDGLSYVWIDTCCIDKSSSSELSEAINSMYEWYKQSSACYAYLQDVESDKDYSKPNSSFRSSQWFTRGWTLQEMVAPDDVIFYTTNWIEIGRKRNMYRLLYDITKVKKSVLIDPRNALPRVCISQIMYWASSRHTTRKEDRAYSLLGLFRINLPILYGEGDSAFTRLQEELLRIYHDHSIFAWHLTSSSSGLLADSADAFIHSGQVRKLPQKAFFPYLYKKPEQLNYTPSHSGLEIYLPHYKVEGRLDLYIAYIACYIGKRLNILCLLLRSYFGGAKGQFFRTRLPSGSLSLWNKIRPPAYGPILKLDKLWILQPEGELHRAIRPLPQGDFTEEENYHDGKIKYFRIEFSVWNLDRICGRKLRLRIQYRTYLMTIGGFKTLGLI